jgi:hypothetical protein
VKLTKRTLLALCIDDFDIRIQGGNLYIFINDKYMRVDMDGKIVNSTFSQKTIKEIKKVDIDTYKKFLDRYFA